MAKALPITAREIHTWTAFSDPEKPCIAMIEGWPMIFYGATPMKAHRAADTWRKNAIKDDKLIPKLRKAEMLGEAA